MLRMSSPVTGRVSQEFKPRVHLGIDIATRGKPGPVYATFAGVVERIVKSRKPGNRATDSYAPDRTGNYIAVRNPDGERQLYNHTQALATLRVGDPVVVGQRLGTTDRSGNTTGHHLHYEEWTAAGYARDPRASFRAFGVTPGAKPTKAIEPGWYVVNVAKGLHLYGRAAASTSSRIKYRRARGFAVYVHRWATGGGRTWAVTNYGTYYAKDYLKKGKTL